jgi:hypothetical protein
MDCERLYAAVQSAQATPNYETILTCTAIIVAVLVGFFTIASVGLGVVAILQWRTLIASARKAAIAAAKEEASTAREHNAKVAQEEARKAAIAAAKEEAKAAREQIAKEAQEEARKWVDIYSDPAKMFKQFGYIPSSDSPTPLPPTAPKTPYEASNEPVGEQLVEAMDVAEPQPVSDYPATAISQGKEESNAVPAETRPEASSPTRSEPESEPEQH